MTVSTLLGLLLQGMAVCLVHVAIRGRWIHHAGALLLLMTVLHHGITEIMQWIWPGRNSLRFHVTQSALDDWIILVSVAILLYAIAYLALLRYRGSALLTAGRPQSYLVGLRLRWLLLLIAPLLLATLQGRTALQSLEMNEIPTRENYLISGISGQFMVFLAGLIGAVVLVRFGTRWTLPLFAVQAGLLMFAGQRTNVVVACLISLYGVALAGVRLPRRQLIGAALVVLFFAMSISAARSVAGREAFLAGQPAGERASALVRGIAALPTADGEEAVLQDTVYRFDGNTFGALVLQGLDGGIEPVGLETIKNSLFLSVPSLLHPGKLSASLEARNEDAYISRRFNLNQQVDFLPGIFGSLVSYLGPVAFLALAALFGLAIAAADLIVAQRATPVRLLLGMGFTQCALLYSVGLPIFFLTMRGVLPMMALLWLLRRLRFNEHPFRSALATAGYPAVGMPTGSPPAPEDRGFAV